MYENNYIGAHDNVEVCHIHGMCDGSRNPDSNNMVLGIDEYCSSNEIALRPDFAIFRKYIQRIRKKTDTSYADWLRNIDSVYNSNGDTWACPPEETRKYYSSRVSQVWSFGHSLDAIDRDVLRQFFGSDATALHVFTRAKADEGN